MNDLLARAGKQIDRASTPVRIAARLRIAHVESATNPSAARISLEMAMAEISSLPFRDRYAFFDLARRVAAAVAPDLLPEIKPTNELHRQFSADSLIQIMLDHGHVDHAADFILHYDDPSTFPHRLGNVLAHIADPERRLKLIRAGANAWRAAPGQIFGHIFPLAIASHLNELPEHEARIILHEIVQFARKEPDSKVSCDYGDVQFTSQREHTLFQVLHLLRTLDLPLAEELIATHHELAAAAARYPNGMNSMREEQERERNRRLAVGATCSGGFIMAGDPGDRDYMMALHRASQDGDFAAAITEALQVYAEDAHPEHRNQAPKEFWPSTVRFGQILFNAGRKNGHAAEALLTDIPDTDLRLLASIELAAALAGLPQLPTVQQQSRPGWVRDRTNSEWRRRFPPERYSSAGASIFGVRVRCPQCNWLPAEESQWSCRCHHRWNTFATRGKCPACEYQWQITSCLNCGHASRHENWYLPEEPTENPR